jgi:plasmid replication initiation protein
VKQLNKRSDYTVSRCSEKNGGKQINRIVFAGGTLQQVVSVSGHRVDKFGTDPVKQLNKISDYTVSRCSEKNRGKKINRIVFAGGTLQQVVSVSGHRVDKFGTDPVKKLNKRSDYTVSGYPQENGGKEINGIVLAGGTL